jgi:hypothetical protein
MVTLVLVSWGYKDRSWAGVPLGLAMAARLWPGLIVLGFWIAGRRRAAYQAMAVFLILNLAGLALPGVSLAGSIGALSDGGADWVDHIQNASLAYLLLDLRIPVVFSVVVAATLSLIVARRYPDRAIPICVVGGLIASPLSWPVYSLAVIPVAVLAWRSRSPIWQGITVLAVSPSLVWLEISNSLTGYFAFATLILLLIVAIRPEGSRGRVTDALDNAGPSLPTVTREPAPVAPF